MSEAGNPTPEHITPRANGANTRGEQYTPFFLSDSFYLSASTHFHFSVMQQFLSSSAESFPLIVNCCNPKKEKTLDFLFKWPSLN